MSLRILVSRIMKAFNRQERIEKNIILIVDDEEDIGDRFEAIIKRKYPNYNILKFTDPESALDEFNHIFKRIKLVISDYKMPKMTGVEMLNKMKEKFSINGLLITAYAKTAMLNNVHNIFVASKPLRKDYFYELIDKHLNETN